MPAPDQAQTCPQCGAPAQVGLIHVRCSGARCQNFDAEWALDELRRTLATPPTPPTPPAPYQLEWSWA